MRSFVRKVPPFSHRNTIPLKHISFLSGGNQFYDDFNDLLEKEVPIKQDIFAADMALEFINDGPVTIILDTKIHRKTCPESKGMFFYVKLLGDQVIDLDVFIFDLELIEASVIVIAFEENVIANG